MNDKQYLEKMIELSKELDNVYSAEPHNPYAHIDVSARINALHLSHHFQRRRRPWWAFITVIMLLIVLLWIVYEVLTLIYMKGTT